MMKPRIERFVDRYAPVLASVLISGLCACFWGLVTWLLGSQIWWLFGMIAWGSTLVGLACVPVGSEYR